MTDLDTASNFLGRTTSSYQYAIDNKLPTWWLFPNCGNGCLGAYVTVYVDGKAIQINSYVPRP